MSRLARITLVCAVLSAGCMRPDATRPAVAAPGDPAATGAATAPEITGRVVDADGPVAAATVRLQATARTATTDAGGRFHIPADPAAPRVTAWKEGSFIGFASPGAAPLEILLKRLPIKDDPSYEWIEPGPDDPAHAGAGSSGSCAHCHSEIYREWEAGAHSRSATGPHFRGLYDGTDWSGKRGVGWSLRDEHPTGLGVCTSCHAPAVADDDPALFDLGELRGTATRGVHCDYCHKVSGIGDGTFGLTHGRFNLRLLRPPKKGSGVDSAAETTPDPFFGPLDDATRGGDVYAPIYRDSRYCASCHEGVVFGVHVYSTYSEWRDSPAFRQGRQCQDCHMKPTGAMHNVAAAHGGVERDPATLANHLFFEGSQAEMLRRCVRGSVECVRQPQGVRAVVRLRTEGAGHRVPTGFIDRHLILTVDGEDAAGQSIAARLGPVLPTAAGKEMQGRAGKLYAKLLRDFAGRSPVPFWRADPDPVDTRLQPDRTDETTYEFPPLLARLRVRVVYRRFWDEVVRSKGWPDGDVPVWDETVSVSQDGDGPR